MVSERKIAANRRNAAKSTGPKSMRGKARSRGNALRHGLAVEISEDPRRTAEIDRIAGLIAGDHRSDEVLVLAREVAVAEFELLRVRLARTALLRRIDSAGLDFAQIEAPLPQRTQGRKHERPKSIDPQIAEILSRYSKLVESMRQQVLRGLGKGIAQATRLSDVATLGRLCSFDRYERRALSRRQRAVRRLRQLPRAR
jgi:hypothetical protein